MDDVEDILTQLRQTWQMLGGSHLNFIQQQSLPDQTGSTLAAPITHQGTPLAWLQATPPPPQIELAQSLLQSWANLLGTVLGERQVMEGLTEKLISAWNRLSFLHQITELMSSTTDLWKLSMQALHFAAETVEVENAFVAQQIDRHLKFLWLQTSYGETDTQQLIVALKNSADMLVCHGTQECNHFFPTLLDIHSFMGQQLRVTAGPPSFIGLINQTTKGNFDAGDIQLFESLIELTTAVIDIEALQNQRISTEKLNRDLEIAAQIQANSLPTQLPDIPGYECAAALTSASKVGGDFYDVCFNEDKAGFLIGDVSGKGIPAALLAANVRATIRAELEQDSSPGYILQRSNQRLYHEMSQLDHFATVALFCLSPQTDQVHYASAGHSTAFWLQADSLQVQSLSSLTLPLGVFLDIEDMTKALQMGSEDVLVIYTDGLIEVEDEQAQLFNMSGVLNVLLATHTAPASFIMNSLLEANGQHRGSAPVIDDLTLLVIKKTSADTPAAQFLKRVHWPGNLRILTDVEAELNELKPYLPASDQAQTWLMQIQLALTEAVSNIIKYAYTQCSGDIYGLIALYPKRLQVDLFDTGQPYPSPPVSPLDFDPLTPPDGGYGLHIIHTVMDSVVYQRLPQEYNHWQFKADIPAGS